MISRRRSAPSIPAVCRHTASHSPLHISFFLRAYIYVRMHGRFNRIDFKRREISSSRQNDRNECTSFTSTRHGSLYVELGARLIDCLAIGFETLWSQCTYALINGPCVPHINFWEPCSFAKVPDGPQYYTRTLDVLWLQEEGAHTHMSEWSQRFTFTKNVGRGFFLWSTTPTQWTVWQPY